MPKFPQLTETKPGSVQRQRDYGTEAQSAELLPSQKKKKKPL